jgi:hypothetical protein
LIHPGSEAKSDHRLWQKPRLSRILGTDTMRRRL